MSINWSKRKPKVKKPRVLSFLADERLEAAIALFEARYPRTAVVQRPANCFELCSCPRCPYYAAVGVYSNPCFEYCLDCFEKLVS